MRQMLTHYITKEMGDDKELLAKVLPDYPPFCSRVLIDNDWFKSLRRPNVDLVTKAVAKITPTGVVDASGAAVECDTIIWGTGFKANKFLFPMDVRGKGGIGLNDFWQQTPH